MTIAQIQFAGDLLPGVDGTMMVEVVGLLAGSCLLIRLARKRSACRLLYSVAALYAAGTLAKLFGLDVAGSLLYLGAGGFFIAMLVVLQRDIRRLLQGLEHWFMAVWHRPQHHSSG